MNDPQYSTDEPTEKLDQSKLPGLEFAREQQVNEIIAFFIIGFGILAVIFFLVPLFGSLLAAITGILQMWLIFQWSQALNTNIDNSLSILQYMDHSKDAFFKSVTVSEYIQKLKKSKIDLFWFQIYVVFYIFGGLSRRYMVYLSLISFVFLGIFLQMVFSSENTLQLAKNHFYSILLPQKHLYLNQIRKRNFPLVILFTVATLGIYWYYLLIKHSTEINKFIASDQENRRLLK
ncbi:MAG TPA: DUF4234 domain-containing protein [Thermotogota bacterium]|nr:DUF4234 domain-containing protein [Thermotogota bacterium]HRW33946.1 DUF4234 domain-containing protein [Thermotogota bacterium]